MLWLTADTHFGHANIVRYCERPFSSVGEMDEEMVRRWNAVVMPGDEVWHLGDLCMGGESEARALLLRLSGQVHILSYPWHHDRRWLTAKDPYWSRDGQVVLEPPMAVLKTPQVGDGGMRVTLCHYPMRSWEMSHFGCWHAYGHTHEREAVVRDNAVTVGVDAWAFAPVSLDELAAKIEGSGGNRDGERDRVQPLS